MLADQSTDIDKEMGYIAEDAFVIPPNGPAVVGAENLRKLLEEMVKTEVISMSGGQRRIEVSKSGDLAYDFGDYRIVNKSDARAASAFGLFSPVIGAIMHEVAAVPVIANAATLIGWKSKKI